MTFSYWHVNPDGRINIPAGTAEKLRILHLDDHQLFREGFKKYLSPYYPEAEFLEFDHGDKAFEFIEREIIFQRKLDLIITDINHPGARGTEFVKAIRLREKRNRARIPIMILSMVDAENYDELVKYNLADEFCCKSAPVETIIEKMERAMGG